MTDTQKHFSNKFKNISQHLIDNKIVGEGKKYKMKHFENYRSCIIITK